MNASPHLAESISSYQFPSDLDDFTLHETFLLGNEQFQEQMHSLVTLSNYTSRSPYTLPALNPQFWAFDSVDVEAFRLPPHSLDTNHLSTSYLASPPASRAPMTSLGSVPKPLPFDPLIKLQYLQVTSPTLSSSAPANSLSRDEKARRRREFHNAVERRRRDLIKDKIRELGAVVPSSLLNPQLATINAYAPREANTTSKLREELLATLKVRDTKANKSTILNMTVVYMKHLQLVLEKQIQQRQLLTQEISNLTCKQDSDVRQDAPKAPSEAKPDLRTCHRHTGLVDPDALFCDMADDLKL